MDTIVNVMMHMTFYASVKYFPYVTTTVACNFLPQYTKNVSFYAFTLVFQCYTQSHTGLSKWILYAGFSDRLTGQSINLSTVSSTIQHMYL